MLSPSNSSKKTDSDLVGQHSSARAWFARTAPALLLAAVLAGIASPLAMLFDRPASVFLRQIKLPGDLQKAIALSEAFAHGLGVAFILSSVYVIAVNRRRAVIIAILITAISGVTANVLKATVVRIRPHAEGLRVIGHYETTSQTTEAVERSFWDARQRSFPSGHAATAWGLAIGLSLVFLRGWWIFGTLAVLACVQRIESGAHYPSDVLAGMSIAFIIAACALASPSIRRQLFGYA